MLSRISGPQSYSSNYTKQSNIFSINYILMIRILKYNVTLQRHSGNTMQTFVVDPDLITDHFFRRHLRISLLKPLTQGRGKDNLAVEMAQLVQDNMSRVGQVPEPMFACAGHRGTPGVPVWGRWSGQTPRVFWLANLA